MAPPAEARPPVDTRPKGIADCAGPETAELLVIVTDEANPPEPLEGGGELVRAGAAIRDASGRLIGVVLASDYLSGESARHARQVIAQRSGSSSDSGPSLWIGWLCGAVFTISGFVYASSQTCRSTAIQ